MGSEHAPHDAPNPFGAHDYEIAYRVRRNVAEVRISATLAHPPSVGDRYTLERASELHEIVVAEITRGLDGAWSARCRFTP